MKESETIFISPEGNDNSDGTFEAPLASLQKALQIVGEKKPIGNVNIYFRKGLYCFDDTAVIDKSCSPRPGYSMTISGWKGEEVILSGGRLLGNWKPAHMDDRNIWKTSLPRVKGENITFKALFRNGVLQRRARSHEHLSEGFKTEGDSQARFATDFCTTYKGRTELHFPEGCIRNDMNLKDLEIYMSPQRPWLVNYLSVDTVDFDTRIATVKSQGTYELTGRFILENQLEFLREPGDWALDSRDGLLYYIPRGEEPEGEFIAPVLQELIRVEGINDLEGTEDDPVENIHFRNLTFSHCDRETVEKGDSGLQHDWAMWDKGNALIRFRGAGNCSVKKCILENSASTAIRLDLYCQNIDIAGNTIRNVGAMGVLLAGYGPGCKDVNHHNSVVDNEISRTGTLLDHSMGIYLWQSGGNLIKGNHICHMGYMGIVLSGVRRRFWNRRHRPRDIRELIPLIDWEKTKHLEGGKGEWTLYAPYMHTKDNVVEYNEVHDCMERLGDGNTIYLSAVGPDNIIRGNLVHSHRINYLMRTDDDCFDSLWEKNILIGSASNPRGFTHKGINRFDNNLLVNCALGVYTGPHGPSEGIGSIKRNIFYFSSPVKGNPLNDGSGFAPGKIDRNLFFSTDVEEMREFLERRHGIESDGESLVDDPRFVNLELLELDWDKDSPAALLGLETFETEKIGSLSSPAVQRIRKKGGIELSGPADLEGLIVG